VVPGEALAPPSDRAGGGVHRRLDALRVERLAGGDELVAPPDLAAVDAELLAFVHAIEHVLPRSVDERDTGLHDADGTAVRVTTGDRLACVHDGRHPRADEPLGGDPLAGPAVDDPNAPGLQS